MTTILIILSCAFYQILHVSVWLFIVLYALVSFSPLKTNVLGSHFWPKCDLGHTRTNCLCCKVWIDRGKEH